MTRIIVLLNLKPGKDKAQYEAWACRLDIPTVNALSSIDKFEVFESMSMLGGGAPPYEYIEVLDVNDMDAFFEDASSETMKAIAAEFQQWADPLFIVTRKIGAAS